MKVHCPPLRQSPNGVSAVYELATCRLTTRRSESAQRFGIHRGRVVRAVPERIPQKERLGAQEFRDRVPPS